MLQPWERVTPHQARVLDLLTTGKNASQIAACLPPMAVGTARRHLERLRTVTGCHSQVELAIWWHEHRSSWVEHITGAVDREELA